MKTYKKGDIIRTFLQDPQKGFVPCFGTVVREVPDENWQHPDVPLYEIMLPNNKTLILPLGLIKGKA